MMRPTVFSRRGRPEWVMWVLVGLGAELAWLGLLYPLVPISALAVAATLALPLAIAAYIYVVARWFSRVPEPRLSSKLWRAVFLLLVLGVGVAIFAGLYFIQRELPGQFRYGVWHRY